jgi:hypothetical protein
MPAGLNRPGVVHRLQETKFLVVDRNRVTAAQAEGLRKSADSLWREQP